MATFGCNVQYRGVIPRGLAGDDVVLVEAEKQLDDRNRPVLGGNVGYSVSSLKTNQSSQRQLGKR